MNEQNELTPKRRAEIKKMRLYLWLGVIGLSIGFAGMWGAVKATQAVLPQPIGLPITLLWCVSLGGWLAFYSFLHRRAMLETYQVTEDAIEISHTLTDRLEKALDLLEQDDRIFDRYEQMGDQLHQMGQEAQAILQRHETYNTLKATLEDDRDALDQLSAPKRGRRPLTRAEIKGEIDRAEQKRAEMQAQGDHPTEAEIARAIGLSPKTLQRYRDRVDNKGQK